MKTEKAPTNIYKSICISYNIADKMYSMLYELSQGAYVYKENQNYEINNKECIFTLVYSPW